MVSCNEESEKKTEKAPASTPEPAAAPSGTDSNVAKPARGIDTNTAENTKPTVTNVKK